MELQGYVFPAAKVLGGHNRTKQYASCTRLDADATKPQIISKGTMLWYVTLRQNSCNANDNLNLSVRMPSEPSSWALSTALHSAPCMK